VLQEALPAGAPTDDDALDAVAAEIVTDYAARKARIPGIGHRTHAGGDPRAVRLFEIARETDCYGPYSALLERVSAIASERSGRLLPVNVTGAIAAIASDMGFRWQITRSFALIGRVLGALAHIQEEMDDPISDELIRLVQRSVDYEPDQIE
jgi:citrate synthase